MNLKNIGLEVKRYDVQSELTVVSSPVLNVRSTCKIANHTVVLLWEMRQDQTGES